MVQVHRDDLEFLNKLISDGDKTRGKLTSTILTLYGAVSSGLFLLVSKAPPHLSAYPRTLFIIVALSAVLIVLFALGEKMLDYFAHVQVGSQHAKNIRESKTYNTTGKYQSLAPNKITTIFLKTVPWILLTLVFINILGAGLFIISRA